MRECLKCGFKDLPIWRHMRQRLYTDYCHINELEDWDPKLAATVKEQRNIKIGPYIYHLTKMGYVQRIHESDTIDGKRWREPEQQKFLQRRILLPQQKRLSEVVL